MPTWLPKSAVPVTLWTPVKVDEPVTASVPVVVAPEKERFDAKRLVVVALVKSEFPERVVEAMSAERLALSAPPMLRTEEMVEEPVIAREVEVALPKVTAPAALKAPAMVEEPEEKRLTALARPVLVIEKSVVVESPTEEDAMAKSVWIVEEAPWRMVRVA